jgi:hypothetical protein
MTRQEIFSLIDSNRESIRALGVRRLGLFGSCAREEQTPSSDVDFLVEFETPSFDAYMDLKFLLEDVLRRPVDLVLANTVKPRIKPVILSEVVYAPRL